MRRTCAALLGALLVASVAGAQEAPVALSERQVEELAFFRRLEAVQPLPRTLVDTFRYRGTTYFLERRTDCRPEGDVGFRLVDLCGNEAPLEAQVAYIVRLLQTEPAGSPDAGAPFAEPVPDEGIVRKWSLHWVPIGVARSWSEPDGKDAQTYMPFAIGATAFAFRMDGGRVFLLGGGAGFAMGNSNPESGWAGVLHLTFVPVSIRAWDRWYIAPTFGTAEVSGLKVPAWPRPFSWKGFKTVGVQISVCLTGCQ